MKRKLIKYRDRFKLFFMLIATISLLMSCEIQKNFDYEYHNPGGKMDLTAWEFIQQTDMLSMMKEAVIAADMINYYSGTTEYTFIVPRNSAFKNYLSGNSYSSLEDVPKEVLKNVLKYHLVKAKVNFADPALLLSNNPIAYKTESEDVIYLSHNPNFQGLINQGTKKSWTIVTSNLEPKNGVIHITDAVVYLSE